MRKISEKIDSKVNIRRMTGYADKDRLKKTLFNAGVRHAGFERVELHDFSSDSFFLKEEKLEEINKRKTLAIISKAKLILLPEHVVETINSTSATMSCLHFGIQRLGRRVVQTAGSGSIPLIPIYETLDDGANIIVAEVIWPNIINIKIHDIDYNKSEDLKFLSRVIREAAGHLKLSHRQFMRSIMELKHESIAQMLINDIDKKQKELMTRIQSAEEQITAKKRDIKNLSAQLDSDKAALLAYDNFIDYARDKFFREIDIIRNINQVVKVDEFSHIIYGQIIVSVKGMMTKCQKKYYYFGDYDIVINVFDRTVRFLNKSNILRHSSWGDECHHPHCSAEGRPCLGNISTQVHELIENFDLAFLVSLCISYLQSVNINDVAGKNVVNWPVCDKNGVIIEEKNSQGLIECCYSHELMPAEGADGWKICEDCGGWVSPEYWHTIETASGEMTVCRKCKGYYKQCKNCGKYELEESFVSCEVCGESVCSSCRLELPGHCAYTNTGQKAEIVCNQHSIYKCEGCGLYLVDTDTCPSCDLGLFSVCKCAVCDNTVSVEHLSSEYLDDICAYCTTSGLEKCHVCGRYDSLDNLKYDNVTGEHYHESCRESQAENVSLEEILSPVDETANENEIGDDATQTEAAIDTAAHDRIRMIERSIALLEQVRTANLYPDMVVPALDNEELRAAIFRFQNEIYQAAGVPVDRLVEITREEAQRTPAAGLPFPEFVNEIIQGETGAAGDEDDGEIPRF